MTKTDKLKKVLFDTQLYDSTAECGLRFAAWIFAWGLGIFPLQINQSYATMGGAYLAFVFSLGIDFYYNKKGKKYELVSIIINIIFALLLIGLFVMAVLQVALQISVTDLTKSVYPDWVYWVMLIISIIIMLKLLVDVFVSIVKQSDINESLCLEEANGITKQQNQSRATAKELYETANSGALGNIQEEEANG